MALSLGRWSCPPGAGGAGCKGFRCPVVCVPSLCPLSRFVFGALPLKYAFIRVFGAFLGGFGRFVWVYVVLVRCVSCVAFVRVWS